MAVGRPSDPSYAVITWDSGNYSSGGAWNDTAKRVAPAGTVLIPQTGATAQNANYLWGAGFDVDASAKTAITATLDLCGQLPALNFSAKVTVDATFALQRADFGVKDQTWYAVGNGGNDWLMASQDYGKTWTKPTLGSTLACLDVVCDASGNVSIINTGIRTVYFGTRSAYGTVTFAATATAISANPSGGGLTYDTVNSKFIACYRTAASGMRVDTSSNGTTWAAQTIPATWSGYTGTAGNPQVFSSNGVTIAAFYDDVTGPNFRIMKSTDGGTTWTSQYNAASGFTGTPVVVVGRPTRDIVNNIWYVSIATATGTRQTAILQSIDSGVTWTQTIAWAAANDVLAHQVTALGALLTMCNDDGRLAWSVNNGVSWVWAGRNVMTNPGAPLGMRSGGGGLLVLNAQDKVIFYSTRFANDGQAV